MNSIYTDGLVLVKGAGDLATGVAWRLQRCGIPVVMTELPLPLAVRRTVAFAQAIFDGEHTVEGTTARRALPEDVPDILLADEIPILVDRDAAAVDELAPTVVVDAIMAKENSGTSLADAALVIALGPGFEAGADCHAVIETQRGHDLGRVYWQGRAAADTGIPGRLTDGDAERVLRSPQDGQLQVFVRIGDRVPAGEIVATVIGTDGTETTILAPITGVLRGLIHERVPITAGLKIGDIDPRGERDHAFTISDKSRAVAGGVLEALLSAPRFVREEAV